jgi:hypothetical protein
VCVSISGVASHNALSLSLSLSLSLCLSLSLSLSPPSHFFRGAADPWDLHGKRLSKLRAAEAPVINDYLMRNYSWFMRPDKMDTCLTTSFGEHTHTQSV